MKTNSVITKTELDGSSGFWVANRVFSAEYPDAQLLTVRRAKDVARELVAQFPHCGIQVIKNYGEKNATGINF